MSYQVRTRDAVYLDGVSLLDFGLAAEMPQPVPPAKQRYTTWQSGDSDHTVPDDSFEDVEYTLTLRKFKEPNNFLNPAFYKLASEAQTLIISRHGGRYYKIRKLLGINTVANHKGNEVIYQITFALAPFAYHINNPEVNVTSTSQIENPGTRYSRPIYKLEHALNAPTNLSVNGQICTINYDAASPLWIDTVRMIAYDANGNNMLPKTSGQFPLLAPGINLLSAISGGTTYHTLIVTGNWRDY